MYTYVRVCGRSPWPPGPMPVNPAAMGMPHNDEVITRPRFLLLEAPLDNQLGPTLHVRGTSLKQNEEPKYYQQLRNRPRLLCALWNILRTCPITFVVCVMEYMESMTAHVCCGRYGTYQSMPSLLSLHDTINYST